MEEEDVLRLALSGSACVGKTTLAACLAERLALTIIPEKFDEGISRRKDKTVKDKAQELIVLFNEKSALESAASRFVSDRSSLDLLHTWMEHKLHKSVDEKLTTHFVNACLNRLKRYDYHIFLPWGVLPLVQVDEDRKGKGVVRNMNKFSQLKHQAYLLGLAHLAINKRRIIEVPRALTELDDRTDYVVEQITVRQKQPFK